MANPPRERPLRAAEPPLAASPVPPTGPRRSGLRGALVGTGIGVAVGLAAVAIAFSIIAIPLFALAATEPERGVDRDLVRKGLFDVALPFGVVTGLVIGVAVGVWYARGGRLPTDRTPLHGR
jgi:riboflavin transporter FmnP